MQTIRFETVDGEVIEVLPVGTAIQHREHPELTGKVAAPEVIPPVPYCIQWDNEKLACEKLGGKWWRADAEIILE